MSDVRPEDLLARLKDLAHDKRLYPFPRKDCKNLIPEGGKYYEDFVTLLDLYGIDMVGRGKFPWRILKLSDQEQRTLYTDLQESFFDKHPQYKKVQTRVTESQTPRLFAQLSVYEQIRQTLLKLLDARH
jgi:hypothetical protein